MSPAWQRSSKFSPAVNTLESEDDVGLISHILRHVSRVVLKYESMPRTR
jgi:hypothetical protein